MTEVYYIGSQRQINIMESEDYGLADDLFSGWKMSHGWTPSYSDDGIYKVTVEDGKSTKENLGKENVGILNNNNVKDILGSSAILPDKDKEYFYDLRDENKIVIELNDYGKAVSENIYNNLFESQKPQIFAINIDGITLDERNVRILKIDDSNAYILYCNIGRVLENKGIKSLIEMVRQIDDISKNPNNYKANEDICDLFSRIKDEYKESAMDINDFMKRYITINVVTENLI